LVIRGDELEPAFVAADEDEVDALCETKLRAWSTVVVFARAALEAAGIELVPTFRVPHVTLAAQPGRADAKAPAVRPSRCREPVP